MLRPYYHRQAAPSHTIQLVPCVQVLRVLIVQCLCATKQVMQQSTECMWGGGELGEIQDILQSLNLKQNNAYQKFLEASMFVWVKKNFVAK